MIASMDLENKAALVTGGTTSLGKAFCEELLKHGAKVLACDSHPKCAGLLMLTDLKEQFGGRLEYCSCDVTDFQDFDEVFEYMQLKYLNVDIVINNADIMGDNLWELEVDVNLNGAIRGTLLAHRHMSQSIGGVVVNIGSEFSLKPKLSMPIYTATKHALIGLTRSCGDPFHYNHTNIRVFAYCPGPIINDDEDDGPKWKYVTPYNEAKELDKHVETQTVEHVAKELIPLLKNAATGSIWKVSGGKSAKEVPYNSFEI